jgi:hypothetical protein
MKNKTAYETHTPPWHIKLKTTGQLYRETLSRERGLVNTSEKRDRSEGARGKGWDGRGPRGRPPRGSKPPPKAKIDSNKSRFPAEARTRPQVECFDRRAAAPPARAPPRRAGFGMTRLPAAPPPPIMVDQ